MPSPPRRHVLHGLLGIAGAGLIPRPARAAIATPPQTEGPFYPTPAMRRPDVDNDLVRIAGQVRRAGGRIIRLAGRVIDRQGGPVPGARVEIWQCDATGAYIHPRDRHGANRDPAFQGFGHDITDAAGRYRFRTIRPVPYPGRAPHIHVKVFTGGREITTQFYTSGEPANLRDSIFLSLTQAERQAVLMEFEDVGGDAPLARLDIRL